MSADASPSRKERIFLLRRRKVWAIIVPYILLIFATLPLTRTFANFLEFNLETDVYRLVLNVVFIAAGAAVAKDHDARDHVRARGAGVGL